jgi:glycerophosphoryl diester phosphodiesterase
MGPGEVTRMRLASLGVPTGPIAAACAQVPVRQYGVRIVDRRFVRTAHARGLKVHVWTINAEQEMDRLLDIGVDGVMTDETELLKSVFERRGLWP